MENTSYARIMDHNSVARGARDMATGSIHRQLRIKDRRSIVSLLKAFERSRHFKRKRSAKTLTDAPGEIVQQGTPMSATNFNNAEVGLLHSSVAFDMLYTIAQAQQRALESRIETLEAQIAALTATAET